MNNLLKLRLKLISIALLGSAVPVMAQGEEMGFNNDPEKNRVTASAATTTHTVTFSINGVTTEETVNEGANISFPMNLGLVRNKRVVGWTTTPLDGTTNEKPEMVIKATMGNRDVTYYAVFAHVETTTDVLTRDHVGEYTYVYNDWSGVTRNSGAVYAGRSMRSDLTIMLGNDGEDLKRGIVTTGSGGRAIRFHVEWYQSSNENGKRLFVYGKDTPYESAADLYNDSKKGSYLGALTYHKGETSADLNKLGVYKYVGIRSAGGILRITSLSIDWAKDDATYSGYCTTVPTTSSFVIAEACKDSEGRYYSTYSNCSAFVVPEDLTVSEISVSDGLLSVNNYETGSVVPPNTGVMVASDTPGEKTVMLTDETGTSVYGSSNCLHGSGDAGITAEKMGAAASGCSYYRLTMHNGTAIGYWWGGESGSAFALAANKAYLAVPNGTGVRSGFTFDEMVDAINATRAGSREKVIYSLTGQRMKRMPRGLCIVNGRKVFIK